MKRSILSTFLLLFFTGLLFAQTDQADGDALIYEQKKATFPDDWPQRTSLNPIPAGDAVEGDYLAQPSFTPDGSRLIVPNRNTDNLTVMDPSTLDILANVPVCDMPFDIGVTADYIVVPCYNSNSVSVIDLDTYAEVASFSTAEHPVKVITSNSGALALVGTDVDEGLLIDLTDLTAITIPDFPCDQYKFSFITSNTRNTLFWTEFGIAPDDSYLINGASDDGLRIYDPETGDLLNTDPNVPYSGLIQLSGDESTWVAMGGGNDATISQIDASDGSLVNQVEIIDQSVWSIYGGPSVNIDGSRALVPAFPGNVALVRFDEGDFQTIATGTTPNWLGASSDHKYGVVGSYYLSLIDFETGAVVDQSLGRPIQNGTVSPGANQMVGYDPLRLEAIHFFDFTPTGQIGYIGTKPTGSDLEADATYSVQMIDDERAIGLNALSGTMSVVNVNDQSLEALIPLGSHETYYAAVTSDGQYALVARRLENDVVVVDLTTYEVVAEISSGGEKPDQVFILPGDQTAYVLNAGGVDRIGIINIDGANSTYEGNFNVGNVGVSWTNYGIRSNIAFTPDGQYGLLPAPFDEQVQIINLESHEVVAELDTEGFPLRVAVGESDYLGTVAMVMLKNSGQVALITEIGPSAGITGGFDIGGNPVSIAFGLADNGSEQPGFYVASGDDQAVHFFSIDALEVIDSKEYGPDRTPTQVAWSEVAGPFVLARGANTDTNGFLDIPGTAPVEYEDIARPWLYLESPVPQRVLVPSLSGDRVLVFTTDIVGTGLQTLDLAPEHSYTVFPQPAATQVTFRQEALVGPGFIRVYDTNGRLLMNREIADLQIFDLPLTDIPVGSYLYQVGNEGGLQAVGKLSVVR